MNEQEDEIKKALDLGKDEFFKDGHPNSNSHLSPDEEIALILKNKNI